MVGKDMDPVIWRACWAAGGIFRPVPGGRKCFNLQTISMKYVWFASVEQPRTNLLPVEPSAAGDRWFPGRCRSSPVHRYPGWSWPWMSPSAQSHGRPSSDVQPAQSHSAAPKLFLHILHLQTIFLKLEPNCVRWSIINEQKLRLPI